MGYRIRHPTAYPVRTSFGSLPAHVVQPLQVTLEAKAVHFLDPFGWNFVETNGACHQRHQVSTNRGDPHVSPVDGNGLTSTGEQVAFKGILVAEYLRQVFEDMQDGTAFFPNAQDLGNTVRPGVSCMTIG